MSELLVNTIKKADGTGSLTVPAESGTVVTTASPSLGRRNLIINGAMQIAQRGTSATSASAIDYYTVDRFNFRGESTGAYTIEQDTDAPANFTHSTKLTVTTPDTSIPSADRYWVGTFLEGNSVSQLNLGTVDAQQFTLSFYIKSSLTGTFSGGFSNGNYDRAYVFEYTINSANTWERKTVTITGDTSGTWTTGTGTGLRVVWDLGSASNRQTTAGAWESSGNFAATGATQVIATNGATFYITGVQLEVGSVATPFEHRSYGEELALCQRYYFEDSPVGRDSYFAVGHVWNGSLGQIGFWTPVPMRTHPSLSHSNVELLNANTAVGSTGVSFDSGYEGYNLKINVNTSSSGFTSGHACVLLIRVNGYMKFDAEL